MASPSMPQRDVASTLEGASRVLHGERQSLVIYGVTSVLILGLGVTALLSFRQATHDTISAAFSSLFTFIAGTLPTARAVGIVKRMSALSALMAMLPLANINDAQRIQTEILNMIYGGLQSK